MATLKYGSISWTVDHAVKGTDYIHAYNADGACVVAFDGVTDFSGFTYSGTYLSPSACANDSCNDVKHVNGALVRRDGSAASHKHTKSEITDFPTSMTPTAHNQAASTITAGTLAGKVQANATAMATLTNAQVRDIVVLASATEGGTTSLPDGTIVFTKE